MVVCHQVFATSLNHKKKFRKVMLMQGEIGLMVAIDKGKT
ncbi:hypothetical protein VPMS16_237 [Vibrio sp. 16]|nr:hypothetical protein VPMS16_237 [Vibrio sp. 16]